MYCPRIALNLKPRLLTPLLCVFSTVQTPQLYSKIPNRILPSYQIIKKIKQILNIKQIKQLYEKHEEEIKKYGMTIFFEIMNDLHMEVHRINRQQYWEFHRSISQIEGLNTYEKGLKLSLWRKAQVYCNSQNVAQHDRIRQKLTKDILHSIQQQQHTLGILFNLMFIFKISLSNDLFTQIIKQIDSKISEINSNKMLHKIWSLFTHTLTNVEWGILSKHENILNILYENEDYSVQSLAGIQYILDIFNKITQLRLHQIGRFMTPKILDKCVRILEKNLDLLNDKNVLVIYQGLNHLPDTFHPEFQKTIRNKAYRLEPRILQYETSLSFNSLFLIKNKNDFDQVFWNKIIFLYKDQELPKRGPLHPRIKQLLDEKIDAHHNFENSSYFQSTYEFLRFLIVGKFYIGTNNSRSLEKVKTIIQKFRNNWNLTHIKRQISMPLLILFLELAHDKTINWVKEQLDNQINCRLDDNIPQKFQITALFIVQNNITSTNIHVRNYLVTFITYLLDLPNNSTNFYRYKIKVLISILQLKRQRAQWKYIDQIIKGNQDDATNIIIIQYFIKQNQATLTSVENLLFLLSSRNMTFDDVVYFVASLKPKFLQNYKGILHRQLVMILKKQKSQLKVTKRNFSMINKFFSNLFTLDKYDFLSDIIVEGGIKISSCLQKHKQLMIDNLAFIDRFVYEIHKIPKSKLIINTFASIYHSFHSIDMVMKEIQLLLSIGQDQSKLNARIKQLKIKMKENGVYVPGIPLTLLKAYCYGYIELEQQQVSEYYDIVEYAIKHKKLSRQTICQSLLKPSYNPSTQTLTKINHYIRPLYLSMKIPQNFSNFAIYKEYLQFFQQIKDGQTLKQLYQILLKPESSFEQIFYILNQNPLSHFTIDMVEKLLLIAHQKPKDIAMLYSQIILYFYEMFYFSDPEHLVGVTKNLKPYISRSLSHMMGQQKQIEQFPYKMEIFLKYVFCWVKEGYNKQFPKFLQKVILVLKKFKLKSLQMPHQTTIVEPLLYYLKISPQPPKQLKEHQLDLEQYLQQNNIKYSFGYQCSSLIIKYYLVQSDEIVISTKPWHHHHITELGYYGNLKYEIELLKIGFNKRVRVFNSVSKKFDD